MTKKTWMALLSASLVITGAAAGGAQDRPGGNGPLPGDPTYSGADSYAQPSDQSPPQPNGYWVSKWGSLASDGPRGILGAAMNLSSEVEAEAAAIAQCKEKGGNPCKVQATFSNQCVALATGDKLFNVQIAKSEYAAAQKAIKLCEKDDVHCRVYYSNCSNPVFVPY